VLEHAAYTTYQWLCKACVMHRRTERGTRHEPLWLSVKQRLDKDGRVMPAPSCDRCQ
jgi:hypothetical protein